MLLYKLYITVPLFICTFHLYFYNHFVSPVDKMHSLFQMFKLLKFHNRWPQKLGLILTKFVSSSFVYLSVAIVRACLGWWVLEIVVSPYLAGHHM